MLSALRLIPSRSLSLSRASWSHQAPALSATASASLASLRRYQLTTPVGHRWNSSSSAQAPPPEPPAGTQRAPEAKLQITFTCTAENCDRHRSTHEFSRNAYEKGIVLVQCPSCHNRHLIADHLGWFNSDDLTQGGKFKTIEALLAAKGEDVKRGHSIQVDKDSGEESADQSNESSRVEIGQIIAPPSSS